MALIKALLKKIEAKLVENGKEDRVPEFKKGATAMVKSVIGKFDEVQIWCGKGFDTEGSICFGYTYEGEEEPTLLFFNDALKEEKF